MTSIGKVDRADWFKALIVFLVMLGIFYAETFISPLTTQGTLVRVAIDIAAFAVLFVGFRFWMSAGKRAVSGRRWFVFFVMLVSTLLASILLPALMGYRSPAGDAFARFASTSVAESIPLVVAIVAVGYAVLWSRRGK
jgi:hypothetical protein